MDEFNQDSRKKALSDEVLRKIGRNVLLFQEIERLLKYLVANHLTDGTATNFAERKQQRTERVQKQMLGQLIEQYTDGILSDAGEPQKDSEEVTQALMSVTFKFEVESDFYESLCTDLKLMLDERNDLTHHFLTRWQPDSLERQTDAISYLDQQREKVLPMLEHLNSVAKAMREAGQEMAAFFESDEGKTQLELFLLQHSPLVALLGEAANQKARPDGWAYLAHAGQFARIHLPDSVKHLKERYGHSTLKRVLIASEFFDVMDERLLNGGFRTLYRVKTINRPA